MIYALLGAILWAFADIVTKELLKRGVPIYQVVLFTGLAQVLVGVSFFKGRLSEFGLLILNSLLISAGLVLFYKSVSSEKVALASSLMMTKVLWTSLLAFLIMKESLSLRELIGILFIVVGAYLIVVRTELV